MQHVSVEPIGNLGRKLTLRVPAQTIQQQVGGRLREMARTARINGFRPGKVPIKVIERRFGPQVRGEVLDTLLNEQFNQAVRENELRIAGRPQMEPGAAAEENNEGIETFVATFEVVPDFGDLDVSRLSIVRHHAEVTDDDIERMIENLRAQRQRLQVAERAAHSGDAVELELWLQVGETRMPPEGTERSSTVIGSNRILADIEAKLPGLSVGEEATIEITFPQDWRDEKFAGQSGQAHIKVLQIREPVLPEVDAEFIRSFGVKSGELDDFRSEIRQNLQRELKGALMNRLRQEVGQKMVEHWKDIELPPNLVEAEARLMLARQVQEAAQRNGQNNLAPPDDAWKSWLEPARKRVLMGLLVVEIARKNDIVLDTQRLGEHLRLIASTYEEPQQVIELYQNDPQLMTNLQNVVMEEQVIDWIADRAQHSEETLTFQQAITPA